jgi:hypothetical protein
MEYRKQADECRNLAAKARNRNYRVQLEELAASWDALADEREKMLRSKELLRRDTQDPQHFRAAPSSAGFEKKPIGT